MWNLRLLTIECKDVYQLYDWCIQLLNNSGRHTAYQRVVRYVFGNDSTSGNNTMLTNRNPRQYDCVGTNPDIVANYNRLGRDTLLVNPH